MTRRDWIVTMAVVLAFAFVWRVIVNMAPWHVEHSTPEQRAAAATVLVADSDGHGSGVAIGHDLVVTARHVVGDNTSMSVTLSTGAKKVGHVLWTSRGAIDLALLDAGTDDVQPAAVACEPQKRGTRIFSHGHPLNMLAVTTWGTIASDLPISDATQDGVLLDLTLLPGNSGGGVWDRFGRLVGLADAIRTLSSGFITVPTGLAVMVPSTTLCRLLGRSIAASE